MAAKEVDPRKRLGYAFVILGFSILILIFAQQINSPTGYFTHNQGSITTETVNVVVGDVVTYTGVGADFSCSDPNCPGDFGSLPDLSIEAKGTGTCICTVWDAGWTSTPTVTLQISANNCNPSASCSPSTQGTSSSDSNPPNFADGSNPNIDPNEETI